MSESFWGTFIISVGVIIISLIFFIQRVTNNDEQVSVILKNTTEAALLDSIDYGAYYDNSSEGKVIRINREAFIENFIRRFSQNASLVNTYIVEFYDVNEYPPKVSIRVKTKTGGVVMDQEFNFTNSSQIDAILESVEG